MKKIFACGVICFIAGSLTACRPNTKAKASNPPSINREDSFVGKWAYSKTIEATLHVEGYDYPLSATKNCTMEFRADRGTQINVQTVNNNQSGFDGAKKEAIYRGDAEMINKLYDFNTDNFGYGGHWSEDKDPAGNVVLITRTDGTTMRFHWSMNNEQSLLTLVPDGKEAEVYKRQ